jgi:hypothetical protein
MCLGRYSFGRWTIVEAILFFFLMPYFFKVSFEKVAWRKRKKKRALRSGWSVQVHKPK